MNGLMQTMREILMFKINADEYTVSKLKRKYLSECADLFDISSLVRYIGILNDCIRSFKSFSSQRVHCECALISLTTPQVNKDFDSLISRISAERDIFTKAFSGAARFKSSAVFASS